jgi:hypothetical protein
MRQRPDTPEFWAMSAVMIDQDNANLTADPDALVNYIDQYLPVDVAMYVSEQRALRVAVKGELSPVDIQGILAALTAMWLDGCLAGMEYQRRREADLTEGTTP